jgi:hypothetical protein
MSATFTPYLKAQAHRDLTGCGVYIRVGVPDGPRPDGSILVYLSNGTGLVVRRMAAPRGAASGSARAPSGPPAEYHLPKVFSQLGISSCRQLKHYPAPARPGRRTA